MIGRYATYSEVDNTDWLKASAILLAAIDHFAIYFVTTQPLHDWMEVPGRLAAPVFFFLIGFATSSAIPPSWLVLGLILMVFDAWGDDWSWGPGSILFSFALFRYVRPAIAKTTHATWFGSILIIALISAASLRYDVSKLLDTLFLYGASGWLWALLGLCQREYIDSPDPHKRRFYSLRWIVAAIAIPVFWLQIAQSYKEFGVIQMNVFAFLLFVLTLILTQFKRGVSRWQPGFAATPVLRFVGRNTLEIYAAQLMISPAIAKLWPRLVI